MAARLDHTYTPDERRQAVEDTCQRIEQGALVADAAREAGITRATLWRWTAMDTAEGHALRDRYVRARSIAAEALEEEALSVARASTSESAAGDRVRIDTLKWAAAKRRPDEYGDKQTVNVNGTIGHLHLAALQAPRTTASAKLSNANDLALPAPVDDEHPSGDVQGE